MQLFLEAVPIILQSLEDTCYSQIIPGIICQSLIAVVGVYMAFYSYLNELKLEQ